MMDCKKILIGVAPNILDETIKTLCKTLIGKGLSFRQAECLLEIAKEQLKDAKI